MLEKKIWLIIQGYIIILKVTNYPIIGNLKELRLYLQLIGQSVHTECQKKISKELLKKGYVKYKNFFFLRTDFRVEWLSKIKKKKKFKKLKIYLEKKLKKKFHSNLFT